MAKLGIQLIIFGKRSGEDLPGVLADVKAAGYDGAEVGNPSTSTPAAEYKRRFDEAGLRCAGYHTGVDALADLDHVKATAEHMNAVGVNHLMAGGKWQDRAGYALAARRLNAAGEVLKAAGVTVCYHNHNWELAPLPEGSSGMDLLLAETEAGVVNFCFDLFWIACGGADLVTFLKTHGHRSDYFHYKDGTWDATNNTALTFTELGRGDVPLIDATTVVRSFAPAWITTEQDRTDGDPANSARLSAEYAREILKI